MSKAKWDLRINQDGTYSVIVWQNGKRLVEHFSLDKDRAEIYDSVKTAYSSKGINFSDEFLTELLYQKIWRYVDG
jgi:hypothetical protein